MLGKDLAAFDAEAKAVQAEPRPALRLSVGCSVSASGGRAPPFAAVHESGCDAVDDSSTGT